MTRRVQIAVGLCAVAAVRVLGAPQELTTAEADSMTRKLSSIAIRGLVSQDSVAPPLRTTLTEREINAFFKYNGQAVLPVGVVNPVVTIPATGRVEGRAIVDLDAVRKSQPPRGMFDPLGYLLRGSVEVQAAGFFRSADGIGTFQLESASCSGISIPKSLLQDFVTSYTRSADLPDGFNLDKPFQLPANIREVQTTRGAATVIQ